MWASFLRVFQREQGAENHRQSGTQPYREEHGQQELLHHGAATGCVIVGSVLLAKQK